MIRNVKLYARSKSYGYGWFSRCRNDFRPGRHDECQQRGGDGTPLTKRAWEFLPGLLAGQSNRKIANHLGLSEVTIKHHLKGLCSKLGAKKRTLAVRLAIELGLS